MGITTQSFGGVTQAELAIVAAKKPYPGAIAILGIASDFTVNAAYTLIGTVSIAGIAGQIWSLVYVKWEQSKAVSTHANDGYKITYELEGETETTLDELIGALAATGTAYYREPLTAPISAAVGKGITIRAYAKSGDGEAAAIAIVPADNRGIIVVATGGTML